MTSEAVRELLNAQSIQSLAVASRACNCIGPQRGERLCPCMMATEGGKDVELHRLRDENARLRSLLPVKDD